jgi:hypothetical protein
LFRSVFVLGKEGTHLGGNLFWIIAHRFQPTTELGESCPGLFSGHAGCGSEQGNSLRIVELVNDTRLLFSFSHTVEISLTLQL